MNKKSITMLLTIIAAAATLVLTIWNQWNQIQDGLKRETEYKNLLFKTEHLLKAQNEALQVLTGGESFYYFTLSFNSAREPQYMILHTTPEGSKSYELHGVRAGLSQCSKDYEITQNSFFSSMDINSDPNAMSQKNGEPNFTHFLGSLVFEDIKPNISKGWIDMPNIDFDRYNLLIKFEALNGEWTEVISVKNGVPKYLIVKRVGTSIKTLLRT